MPLASQARTLLEQRILRQLSVGWISRQTRWVTSKDADLDPHVKEALADAGVDEALAFMDWYPVEGSVVDVADDPAARLAASAGGATAAAIAAVDQRIVEFVAGLDQRVADLVESAIEAVLGSRAERRSGGEGSLSEAYRSDFACEDDDGGGEPDDDGRTDAREGSGPQNAESAADLIRKARRILRRTPG